jgi:hypothetical protein
MGSEADRFGVIETVSLVRGVLPSQQKKHKGKDLLLPDGAQQK